MNESVLLGESFDFVDNVNQDGDFSYNSDKEEQGLNVINAEIESNIKDVGTLSKTNDTEAKLGHRRVDTDGGVSFKKIKSSSIMDSIQMGIRRSVGRLATEPERDILMIDFMTVESTSFTAVNSTSTSDAQFVFKTYAPEAFRHFRGLFGIKPESFVSSFCDAPLVELPNPGASGSLFYVTQNDKFITKTVNHREAGFLQKLLPGYYLNLNQNPKTLLPKFFGVFCYKLQLKNVRLVVMNNVLPSSIKIHQKYDLKGSTYNRTASKAEHQKISPTFKDLDFMRHHPEGIFLDSDNYKTLLTTIERDCRVLESFQIMDYSLLLGIHNLDQAKRENVLTKQVKQNCSENEVTTKSSGDGNGKEVSNELDDLSDFSGLPARRANGEKLLLFIGVIDILQSYRLLKRVEHIWKSVVHNGASVSVHNPAFYATRFQQFMSNSVFKPMPHHQKLKRSQQQNYI